MPYTLEKLRDIGMPIAMAALVEAASRRETITYKDIALRIRLKLRSTIANEHIGGVLGDMMESIYKVAPKVPPINALCVRGTTKLPGSGVHYFLNKYNTKINYNKLSDEQKREALLPIYEDVFKFKSWSQLAYEVFGIKFSKKSLQQLDVEHDGKGGRLGYGGPAESEEHRRLKMYIRDNPKLVGAPRGCKVGQEEKILQSFDEIDVWFLGIGEQLAVEVKSRRSSNKDLERGVYQCVKYRAVLEAENKANKINSNVRACLVLERAAPAEVRRLAKLFAVDVRLIRPA